jgi:hypothetical protein
VTVPVQDKYDQVIYDVEGIKYFSTEFQTDAGPATEEEGKLIDDLLTAIRTAIEFKNTARRRCLPACADMDRHDASGQDLDICPKLLSGISDTKRPARDIAIARSLWKREIDRRTTAESDNISYVRRRDSRGSILRGPCVRRRSNTTMSQYPTTLINDRARVYKAQLGRPHLLANTGTRRYLDERQSTATIGFRCA